MGAALIAAWAGGTGIASATDDTSSPVDTGSGCEAPVLTATEGELADAITEGTDEGDDESDPISPEPCGTDTDVTVDVLPDGDCLDPETFTFVVNAEGLEAGVTYTLLVGSKDITPTDPTAQPVFIEDIPADENGNVVDYTFRETEGDTFTAPSTGLDFGYLLFDGFDTDWQVIVGGGEVGLDACEPVTEPVVVPAEPTHPDATPVAAAPVVVTHPAVAQPAVLANTGTPVTTAALLGGGLLVAGAGALVAGRRRAS